VEKVYIEELENGSTFTKMWMPDKCVSCSETANNQTETGEGALPEPGIAPSPDAPPAAPTLSATEPMEPEKQKETDESGQWLLF